MGINKLIVFLLLVTGLCYSQSAQRISVAVQSPVAATGYAKLIPHASIYVCTYNSQLNCSSGNYLSIYSDVGLTSGISQPLVADSVGGYQYYVQAGTQVVEKVCYTGAQCQSYAVYIGTSNLSIPTLPASPSFAVQFANSGATQFQADSSITVNPTTHTFTAPNISASNVAAGAGVLAATRGVYNVNLACDGTTDDGPALVAAIAAAPSTPYVIQFPQNSLCRIGSIGTVAKPIKFDLNGSTIEIDTTGDWATLLANFGGITFKNGKFTQYGSVIPTNIIVNGTTASSAQNTTFDYIDFTFAKASHALLWNQAAYGLHFDHGKVHDNTAPSMFYYSNNGSITVFTVMASISDTDFTVNTGAGITIEGGSLDIKNSVIESESAGGIQHVANASPYALYLNVEHVDFENNGVFNMNLNAGTASGIITIGENSSLYAPVGGTGSQGTLTPGYSLAVSDSKITGCFQGSFTTPLTTQVISISAQQQISDSNCAPGGYSLVGASILPYLTYSNPLTGQYSAPTAGLQTMNYARITETAALAPNALQINGGAYGGTTKWLYAGVDANGNARYSGSAATYLTSNALQVNIGGNGIYPVCFNLDCTNGSGYGSSAGVLFGDGVDFNSWDWIEGSGAFVYNFDPITSYGIEIKPAATPTAFWTQLLQNASGTIALTSQLPFSAAITSATGGTNTGTVTCLTATCTNLSGTYSVVGSTFTTGNFLTLVWPTTTTVYNCWTSQNGGVATYGIGHSVATATGMVITAGITPASVTVTIDYGCSRF